MNKDFQRELNRVKNLKQNKGKPEEELFPVVKKNLIIRKFKEKPLFEYTKTTELSDQDKKIKKQVEEDQKLAEEKFRNYLDNYKLESDSDLDTLASLVYNEVLEKQIQREINKILQSGKYPSDKLTKQLTDLQNQKAQIKLKLGIDKVDEKRDELSEWELLEKRVYSHIQENKHEHTIGVGWECEKCGHKDWEQYLLWYKIKDFKTIKHPWFVGRWLFNPEIMKDVRDGKLNKEDAMRYLVCAGQGGEYNEEYKKYCADYIDYCLENWAVIADHIKK